MGRSPKCVFSYNLAKKRGAGVPNIQYRQHIYTNWGRHVRPLMLPCVSVSASLAYLEKRDRTESRFSIFVRACVWKRVKPGVSHAWRDMKEQGILCRKGLLSLTHTRASVPLFSSSVLRTLSWSREKIFNAEHEYEKTWWSLLMVPVNKWVEPFVQLKLPLSSLNCLVNI